MGDGWSLTPRTTEMLADPKGEAVSRATVLRTHRQLDSWQDNRHEVLGRQPAMRGGDLP